MTKGTSAVIIASVIAFAMLLIPLSVALVSSTSSVGENQVFVTEDQTGGLVIADYNPKIRPIMHGNNPAFRIHHEESDHLVKYNRNNQKTFFLTIPAKIPFCIYIENDDKFYLFGTYVSTFSVEIVGTQYQGGSQAPGKYYFSSGNANGFTMNPVHKFNDVVFMVYEEDVVLKIHAFRQGTPGVEATLKMDIVFG